MCGIAGIYSNSSLNKSEHEIVKTMLSEMRHRGPDGMGLWSDNNVALGHALLAIIGVGSGKQPMSNEDNSIWVTFNGEIYNYKQLKTSLKKKGHIFKTHTDTEVLVHLYEEYAEDLVHHLNGMFAFAIWDSKNKKLVLARDRLGVKPLFISKYKDGFIFGSELKALKASGVDIGDVDPLAIFNYLRFKHVGSNRSIYNKVFKVPPGNIISIKDKKFRIKQYWAPVPKNDAYISKERVRDLIIDATNIRLRSDVPLSISLSGGLDSSIVLYEAVQSCGYNGEAFSIKYPGMIEDESSIAKNFANEMGIKHNIISFDHLDTNLIPKLVDIMDEPFGDYSAYPSYMLFKEQSKFSTVVLTGDGGDEAFGGYSRYLRSMNYKNYLFFMNHIKKLIPNFINTFLPRKLNIIQEMQSINQADFYREILAINSKKEIYNMCNDSFIDNLDHCFKSECLDSNSQFKNIPNVESLIDYLEYLPGDVLAKVDLTSMHSSIEARSPLLDYRIAEFGISMSPTRRIKKNVTKAPLREIYQNLLPEYIINGKKRGFTVPISYWQTPEFNNYAKQVLLDNSIICSMVIKREKLEQYFKNSSNENSINPRHIWNFVMLENWFQNNKMH